MAAMTKKEFRALIAEKVMPAMGPVERALISMFLNGLNDNTFAVIQEMFGQLSDAFETGGIEAVRHLLSEYQVPQQLIDGLLSESPIEGMEEVLTGMGLPANLVEGLRNAFKS